MKKLIVFVILFAVLGAGVIFLNNKYRFFSAEYVVTEVLDGDTVKLKNNKGEIRVRLFGVDAPEKKQLTLSTIRYRRDHHRRIIVMIKSTLGQRMKGYEKRETEMEFLPLLPVYARIDGRSFHTFTRGMKRPYDENLSRAMIETTKYLVEHTHAKVGYTQSDEIQLVFCSDRLDSQIFFDGSIFKMTSNLASMATAKFMQIGLGLFHDRVQRMLPTFDCRVTQFPTKEECVNMLVWRVRDAVKNSVSMAASTVANDSVLKGANTAQRMDLLHVAGINWNDYPQFFKEGSFVKRIRVTRMLSTEELARIPERHRPTGPVTRSHVVELAMPPFERIVNKVGFVFNDETPYIMEGDLAVSKYSISIEEDCV